MENFYTELTPQEMETIEGGSPIGWLKRIGKWLLGYAAEEAVAEIVPIGGPGTPGNIPTSQPCDNA